MRGQWQPPCRLPMHTLRLVACVFGAAFLGAGCAVVPMTAAAASAADTGTSVTGHGGATAAAGTTGASSAINQDHRIHTLSLLPVLATGRGGAAQCPANVTIFKGAGLSGDAGGTTVSSVGSVDAWAPGFVGRNGFPPPEKNELVLSILKKWVCRYCDPRLCPFSQNQTPRSNSANLEPSEPIFCPQTVVPRSRSSPTRS